MRSEISISEIPGTSIYPHAMPLELERGAHPGGQGRVSDAGASVCGPDNAVLVCHALTGSADADRVVAGDSRAREVASIRIATS